MYRWFWVLLVVFLLSPQIMQAQDNELIWFERFDGDPDGLWYSDSGSDYSLGVSSGVYQMNDTFSRSDDSRWFWHSFNRVSEGSLILLPENFDLHVTIQAFSSTTDNGCISFLLNPTDELEDMHQLQLCNSGIISLIEQIDGDSEIISQVKSEIRIAEGGAHTFGFRVENGEMTASVDDLAVGTITYLQPVISFGFILSPDSKDNDNPTIEVEFDDLEVYALESQSSDVVTLSIDPPAGERGVYHLTTIRGLQPNEPFSLQIVLDGSERYRYDYVADIGGSFILILSFEDQDESGVYDINILRDGEIVAQAPLTVLDENAPEIVVEPTEQPTEVVIEPTEQLTEVAAEPTAIAEPIDLPVDGELIWSTTFDDHRFWYDDDDDIADYGVSDGAYRIDAQFTNDRKTAGFWSYTSYVTRGDVRELPENFEMRVTVREFTSSTGRGCAYFYLNPSEGWEEWHRLVLCEDGSTYLQKYEDSQLETLSIETNIRIAEGGAHILSFRVINGELTARVDEQVVGVFPYAETVSTFGFLLGARRDDDGQPHISVAFDDLEIYEIAASTYLSAGQSVTGEIKSNSEEAFWELEAEAGEVIGIRVEGEALFRPYMELIKPDSQLLAIATVGAVNGIYESTASFDYVVIPESGIYTIMIRSAVGQFSTGGEYTLFIEQAEIPEVTPFERPDDEVLLFSDDFSNNDNNWTPTSSWDSEAIVEDGALQLSLNGAPRHIVGPNFGENSAPIFDGSYAIEFTVSDLVHDGYACFAVSFAVISTGDRLLRICPAGLIQYGDGANNAIIGINPLDLSEGEHRFRVAISEEQQAYIIYHNEREIARIDWSSGFENDGYFGIGFRPAIEGDRDWSVRIEKVEVWGVGDPIDVVTASQESPTVSVLAASDAVAEPIVDTFDKNNADWRIADSNLAASSIDDGVLHLELKNAPDMTAPMGDTDRNLAPLVAGDYELEFTLVQLQADTESVCFTIIFDIRRNVDEAQFAFCQDDLVIYTKGDEQSERLYDAPDFASGSHQVRLQVTQQAYTLLIDDTPVAQITDVLPTRGSITLGLTRGGEAPGQINVSAVVDDLRIRLFEHGRLYEENEEGYEIVRTDAAEIVVLTQGDIASGSLGAEFCTSLPAQAVYLFYARTNQPVTIRMVGERYGTVEGYEPPSPGFSVADLQGNILAYGELSIGLTFQTLDIVTELNAFVAPEDGFYAIAVGSGGGAGCVDYGITTFVK